VVAFSAKDIDKLGLTDEEQIDIAIKNQAIIFTHDVDFLRIALRKRHPGIIYVHQQKLSVGECIRRLKVIAETKSPKKCRIESYSYEPKHAVIHLSSSFTLNSFRTAGYKHPRVKKH